MKKINNILVVNVNWLGDVVFSSPIFPALKEAYPHAHICCLAPPRVTEILESIPGVDEVIIFDEKGKHRSVLSKVRLILQLRRYHFDIAFILHGSLTRALMVFWAGIPVRVGYPTKGRRKYLTHAIEPIPDVHAVHRSDFYIHVVESYGVEVNDQTTCLVASEKSIDEINNLLREKQLTNRDFLVALNPGGNWDLKRWPAERFSRLADRLSRDFQAKVILTGAMKDMTLAKEIISGAETAIINLTGKLSLKQLIALFKKMDLVISGDSGPIHLASSVGANVIGLFGPTMKELTGPRGKGDIDLVKHDLGCNRRACYQLDCPNNLCMQSITVDSVLTLVAEKRKKF